MVDPGVYRMSPEMCQRNHVPEGTVVVLGVSDAAEAQALIEAVDHQGAYMWWDQEGTF